MTSSRPYLLQAIYDWLNDNQLTPYLLVDAEYQDVVVPTEYIQDGKIILNIGYTAVQTLDIQQECITFSARFSGKPMQIYIPMQAALALYAMENGKGMVFPEEQLGENGAQPEIGKAAPSLASVSTSSTSSTKKNPEKKKSDKAARPSFLKVVK
ncbi:MAG: ClpXP protease specificity-enhancing factor [Pseudomonadota bacterium]